MYHLYHGDIDVKIFHLSLFALSILFGCSGPQKPSYTEKMQFILQDPTLTTEEKTLYLKALEIEIAEQTRQDINRNATLQRLYEHQH